MLRPSSTPRSTPLGVMTVCHSFTLMYNYEHNLCLRSPEDLLVRPSDTQLMFRCGFTSVIRGSPLVRHHGTSSSLTKTHRLHPALRESRSKLMACRISL